MQTAANDNSTLNEASTSKLTQIGSNASNWNKNDWNNLTQHQEFRFEGFLSTDEDSSSIEVGSCPSPDIGFSGPEIDSSPEIGFSVSGIDSSSSPDIGLNGPEIDSPSSLEIGFSGSGNDSSPEIGFSGSGIDSSSSPETDSERSESSTTDTEFDGETSDLNVESESEMMDPTHCDLLDVSESKTDSDAEENFDSDESNHENFRQNMTEKILSLISEPVISYNNVHYDDDILEEGNVIFEPDYDDIDENERFEFDVSMAGTRISFVSNKTYLSYEATVVKSGVFKIVFKMIFKKNPN